MLRRFLVLWVVLVTLWLVSPAHAQSGPVVQPDRRHQVEWQELDAGKFLIVYGEQVTLDGAPITCMCGVQQAERYASFVDPIYTDLVQIFETELPGTVNIRLFPTEDAYYQVNPLARQLTGVIAHALNTSQEIAIALPRTQSLPEEELVNNLRHEMTHLFASALSGGELTAGFHEGVAQYLERPTNRARFDPDLLRQAHNQDRLFTWAELDESRNVYGDPQVAYPQALSMVSFLVDRYGFPALVDFITAHTTEPGYRSALLAAYGKSADELETEWLDYLPEYLAGRWQINALYAYDLTRVTTLVNNGAYTAATDEIAAIVDLLRTTNQTETLAQAEALLQRADAGVAAAAIAAESRQALLVNDYALAISKGYEAMAAYDAVQYYARVPELQLYIHRAELGQQALRDLEAGERLIDSLRFAEGEAKVYEAAVLLQALNDPRAAEGTVLLAESAQRQSFLAYFLLGVGLLLLLVNGLRRLVYRLTAPRLEVEFT